MQSPRSNSNRTQRRDFLKLGSVGALLTATGSVVADEGGPKKPGLPDNWRQQRKIDMHNHVMESVHQPGVSWARVERTVATAERLGITTLCCSHPITGGALAEIAAVREANDSVLAAMKRYPQLIKGFAFIQPGNGPAAVEEIARCCDAGMIGVKLYNQYKYSDPIVYPIAEKCIDLGIPLLGHSGHLTDPKTMAAQPKTSDSLDFCQLGWRYPELMLILGHVNGGGDWEWAIKGLRECSTVYLDTSGSVLESDTIEMCVRELGVERILFATDQTMEGGVGKILGADLTESQRQSIFSGNAEAIFKRRR